MILIPDVDAEAHARHKTRKAKNFSWSRELHRKGLLEGQFWLSTYKILKYAHLEWRKDQVFGPFFNSIP